MVASERPKASEADEKDYFNEIVKQSGQKLDAIEKFYKDNTQRKQELHNEIERRKAMQLMLDHAKAK